MMLKESRGIGRVVATTATLFHVPQQSRFFSVGTEKIGLGKVYRYEGCCFSDADVTSYTQLTGDANPIHISVSAAQEAGFSKCVVPGMLCGSLFPAIIGSRFAGAVYVSQDLRFKAPLLVGELFLAEVEVSSIVKLRQKAKVTFSTRCVREVEERQPVLLDGQAVALLPMSFID